MHGFMLCACGVDMVVIKWLYISGTTLIMAEYEILRLNGSAKKIKNKK